ncbi:GNAT family N-acetyltransferase [Virgibacillus dakarensis]|uniref:N-acetyltransferase n=1 Tax=Lentibacillus populi TaxID=1827502 RepID=A0A9W5X6V5_9BACI|nr:MULTISPECIES: GNAT family N-acetyltransferase [Bacillaceae]MBT2218239.1 GNAT family N-acetyltransferase [Virgibacillus dakarensis]MTW85533.1 GNAT family N-acetyltransferase [Virgibacillus dakarensis]GGB51380.1 N-acetyltransferase [Lentibacillus populi]
MFSIRRASYADAEAIANIHVTSWKNTYTDLVDEKDLSNITYENRKTLWEAVLRMQKKEQCTFVIQTDGKTVGFVSGGPERTKRFNYDSEIYTIYLLPEYQRKGLGAMLLRAFAEEMKEHGYQSLLVWVLTQNPSSRFYKRYDAKPVGEEKTTIGEGTYQETAYGWESIEQLLASWNKA